MSLLELAKKRYSVRKYEDRAVESEKLEKIIEAAHVAPTAANLQPVRLIVVQEKESLNKLGKAANLNSKLRKVTDNFTARSGGANTIRKDGDSPRRTQWPLTKGRTAPPSRRIQSAIMKTRSLFLNTPSFFITSFFPLQCKHICLMLSKDGLYMLISFASGFISASRIRSYQTASSSSGTY